MQATIWPNVLGHDISNKMPPIGFVLLVNPFNKIEQSARLIDKLNAMFEHPPIAVHHDFSKNPKFLSNPPRNVRLVDPHVVTKWADFSCIEAAVKALKLLYSGAHAPDWFVYLSGSDYPIKPAARILGDLQSSPFDAHIEHARVLRRPPPHTPLEGRLEGHKGDDWPRHCHRRYCSMPITVPWITRRLELSTRTFQLEHPLLTSWQLPFSKEFACYAGEAWFCANRRAARVILDSYTRNTKWVSHSRKVLCPEESYFHTVLANAPSLCLSQDPLRYMDWTVRGNHPKVLSVDDLPRLTASNAHFARKFAEDISSEMHNGLEDLTR